MLHGLVIVQYGLAESKAGKDDAEELVERMIAGQTGYNRLPPCPEGFKFAQDLRVPVDLNSDPKNIDGFLPPARYKQNSTLDQVMFGIVRFGRN